MRLTLRDLPLPGGKTCKSNKKERERGERERNKCGGEVEEINGDREGRFQKE